MSNKKFENAVLAVTFALIVAGVAASLIHPPAGSQTARASSGIVAPRVAASDSASSGVVQVSARAPRFNARSLHSADTLNQTFSRMGYDLGDVRSGDDGVPRVYLASLPADLRDVRDVGQRKSLFFRSVLPLVLKTNERILADRKRLWDLRARKRLGETLPAQERLWLAVMAERYGTERGDLDALMARVDIVPPSLALAQAAEESGWGTSRFVREGNALFGQWTWSGEGIKPKNREEGKTHRVRAFESLDQSVAAYMRNLNTHRAYKQLRKIRAAMRRAGQPIQGKKLLPGLKRYSERGVKYIEGLQTIMSANGLAQLDDARLRDGRATNRPSI